MVEERFRRRPPVSVTLRGEPLPATARPVGDPQAVERGLRLFISRFPSNAKPFGVAPGRGKLPDEEGPALAARDRGIVIVGIRPLGGPEV